MDVDLNKLRIFLTVFSGTLTVFYFFTEIQVKSLANLNILIDYL